MSISIPDSSQSTTSQPESQGPPLASNRAKWSYLAALVLLYVLAVLPRLYVAGFDEPDLTYGDELMTIDQAERLLRDPNARIEHFHKGPGAPHFLYITFKAYYALVKNRYGWQSIDDVQWWRVRRFWRSLNILLSSLTVILAGVIGAAAFNRRVGLVAAAFMAASRMCTFWFTFMKEDGIMTLFCGVVVYVAYRVLLRGRLTVRWVVLAGLATGTALVFKHDSLTVLVFFVFVLVLADIPPVTRRGLLWRFSQFRFLELFVYVAITALTVAVWFPQLITRTSDVWQSVTSQPQTNALEISRLEIPPRATLLSVAWDTWNDSFHTRAGLTDTYPFYFFLLMTIILVAAPFYALVRRDRFVLALSLLVWITYLVVYEQWLFSGWRFSHYFMPAFIAIYLLVAFGLDGIAGWVSTRLSRRYSLGEEPLQSLLVLFICAWPLVYSYTLSVKQLAWIRGGFGNTKIVRAEQRRIVRAIPAGSKVFQPLGWLNMRISDKFLENRRYESWRRDEWKNLTLDDLVRLGFDLACIENYDPKQLDRQEVYARQLAARHIQPIYTQPKLSHFNGRFSYVPVQPGDGQSFNVGLYFREPSGGDFGGVRGVVPAFVGKEAGASTRSMILKTRLSNEVPCLPKFIRWDITVDGRPIWHGRDTSDTKHAVLALNLRARPGSEILIRTMRTAYRPAATWNWGGRFSNMKIDGLRLLDAASSKPIPIKWTYVGLNGGPEPEYAMRHDWCGSEAPVALLDPGFEGPQPLVDAWRPYRRIDPKAYDEFPGQWRCREKARIRKAPGRGLDGSNALRFVVGLPAKKSATLGIMQPIAYPACRNIDKLRVHYRPDGAEGNRGKIELRLAARAVGLSGAYIDRAEASVPVEKAAAGGWRTLQLDVQEAWKRRHTRVDLIEFLEVSVEITCGPDTVFDYLIDGVEWE